MSGFFLLVLQSHTANGTYVAPSSTRHLTNSIRDLDIHFSISNFQQAVLGYTEADLRDQIRIGKLIKRSTCVLGCIEIYKLHTLLATSIFKSTGSMQMFYDVFY